MHPADTILQRPEEQEEPEGDDAFGSSPRQWPSALLAHLRLVVFYFSFL
jgi:hypothetical protein